MSCAQGAYSYSYFKLNSVLRNGDFWYILCRKIKYFLINAFLKKENYCFYRIKVSLMLFFYFWLKLLPYSLSSQIFKHCYIPKSTGGLDFYQQFSIYVFSIRVGKLFSVTKSTVSKLGFTRLSLLQWFSTTIKAIHLWLCSSNTLFTKPGDELS